MQTSLCEANSVDFEAVRQHLGRKRGAREEFPFGPHTLVFKVGGKMFALMTMDENPPKVTLKCDPMEAEALRAVYNAVQPGRYMHKAHWNTVTLDGSIPDATVREMLDDSYALIVQGLRRSDREALEEKGDGE